MVKRFIALLVLLHAAPGYAQLSSPTISSLVVPPQAAAWTSATSANAAVTLVTQGMGIAAISLNTSGAITAGQIDFEVSDDGFANAYPTSCIQTVGGPNIPVTNIQLANFSGGLKGMWQCGIGAYTGFRARLSTQISGAGTANVRANASSMSPETYVTVIPGSLPSYAVFRSVAAGAALDALNIFNASGSGRVLRVMGIYASWQHTAAVTAVNTHFTISRTNTVGTTCTAVTPALMDTQNPALPSQVTSNGTCTTDPVVSADLIACALAPEEGSATGTFTPGGYGSPCYEYSGGTLAQPITLREGFGLMVKSVATLVPTGTWGITIVFTASPQ